MCPVIDGGYGRLRTFRDEGICFSMHEGILGCLGKFRENSESKSATFVDMTEI
jgi:hypothetical protein